MPSQTTVALESFRVGCIILVSVKSLGNTKISNTLRHNDMQTVERISLMEFSSLKLIDWKTKGDTGNGYLPAGSRTTCEELWDLKVTLTAEQVCLIALFAYPSKRYHRPELGIVHPTQKDSKREKTDEV